ncbi:MAG TPA: DUF5317 domain-containing protein [Actinomycetota bacterium]|nr:DUF5317 domain-containing protein [Actinomycetota bacterium]
MFLVAIVLASALAVPLLGGRLGALAEVRLRLPWLLPAALAMQVVALDLPGVPGRLRPPLHVASYLVAGAFLVANRRLPGMPLVGLGAAANLLAIGVNGGVMPASPAALAAAGLPLDPPGFANSAVLADPRLAFLGDVFAIPRGWPLANVFSVGDVLIAIGAVVAVHGICGSRLPWRRGR